MSASGGSMPRLGPAWRSTGAGRGFQPPPAVPDEQKVSSRERSGSHASGGSGGGSKGEKKEDRNLNPFAMLDDEEDNGNNNNNGGTSGGGETRERSGSHASGGGGRFSALRSNDNHNPSSQSSRPSSSHNRASSSGAGRPSGRSLADLAKGLGSKPDREERADPRLSRSSSHGNTSRGRSGSGSGQEPISDGGGGGSGGAKVIRYTREKLLSLRGRGDDGLPGCLKELEDSVIVSKESQDPVCWDTFDPEEAWAASARERRPNDRMERRGRGDSGDEGPPRGSIGAHRGNERDRGEIRGSDRGGGGGGFGGPGGRWQRGVSLPEGDPRTSTNSNRQHANDRGTFGRSSQADNPDDLWDDPGSGGTGAAMDFSAFGGSLEDDHPKGRTGMNAFELTDMSKAAAAFENELHADRKSDDGKGDTDAEEDEEGLSHNVDPSRPLASTGTTIRSGSGDHVNVFEDFGDESGEEGVIAAAENGEEELPIKSASGGKNASSSMLMKMIGVSGTGEAAGASAGKDESETKPDETKSAEDAAVPSNPWGAPAPSLSINPWGDGAAGRDSSATAAQAEKERQQQQQQEAELRRRRLEEEQARQQQAATAQQQQAEQVKAQQSQVELVLIERISNILENSWGRSDLSSVLSTLHANDSRVIAILSTVDALRALIARHPARIQLGRDPTMGAEMAAIRMTNAQWQAHEQAQAAQRAQQEAMARQQQLQMQQQQAEMQRVRQMQEEQARQQQEAMARAQREAEERKLQQAPLPVITDAPWYYADPQGNIQGPFTGNEMRQWLEAGYFKTDLPISQNASGPFRPLGSYFSEAGTAFQPQEKPDDSKAKEEAQQRAAAAEAEAKQAQAAKAEAEAKARAEALAAKAAQEKSSSASPNEQSAQLKMMLGLGGKGGSSEEAAIAGPPQQKPKQPAAAKQQQPAPTKKQSKKNKQQQQAASSAPEQAPPAVPTPAAPPAAAWGGVAVKGSGKKTMAEIQQEEAREAARRAKENPNLGQKSGGGWANIAATGGSTAWGGSAAKMPAAAVVTPAQQVAVGGLQQKAGTQAAWNTKQPSAPAPATATVKKQQKGTSNKKGTSAANAPAAAVDNFGANGRMSPALESWCKDQMRQINNSDDLTLVSFCMTLTDKDEIRQYLTAYLGSTPAVNNFATEFIRRRGIGENGRSAEQWESAGTKGKGRKKKGGK